MPPTETETEKAARVCAENEEWRPVVGYEGLYEVSNLGRVWSVRSKMPLRLSTTRNRYHCVTLCDQGRYFTENVHRLVAKAFLGAAPSANHEVAHYDGNPKNNRLDNLRWATRSENMMDAIRHGTLRYEVRRGEAHERAKLTDAKVARILEILARGGVTQKEIGKMFGVDRTDISRINRGVSWRHIPRPSAAARAIEGIGGEGK